MSRCNISEAPSRVIVRELAALNVSLVLHGHQHRPFVVRHEDYFGEPYSLLVVGAHAHVPQDIGCHEHGADYFGLGNHLFDQPHESTWRGLLVRRIWRPSAR